MQYLGDSRGTFCNRSYYKDDEGRLVSVLEHDPVLHRAVMRANAEAAAEFRPHQKGEMRRVASFTNDMLLKWLIEEGVPGICSEEAIDMVVNKKLKDPQYKYLFTVPESYRMMRYG